MILAFIQVFRMKRPLLLLTVCFLGVCAFAKDIRIDESGLPEKCIGFVRRWFPESSVKKVELEKRASMSQYEIRLSDGTKLQFDMRGDCTEVDCGCDTVPYGIIPQKIRNYIGTEYPDRYPVRIEHDTKLYEVQLDDGCELTFNTAFRLLDIDDGKK